jgi:hypothetical protein
MSIRALIGIVHAFVTPGNCIRALISSISSSLLMRSLQIGRSGTWRNPGSPEYHRSFDRHWSGGLRRIVVSSIENGAGSVEVSARPAFPKTRSTSGTVMRIRSMVCISFWASVTEMPGSVVGM